MFRVPCSFSDTADRGRCRPAEHEWVPGPGQPQPCHSSAPWPATRKLGTFACLYSSIKGASCVAALPAVGAMRLSWMRSSRNPPGQPYTVPVRQDVIRSLQWWSHQAQHKLVEAF